MSLIPHLHPSPSSSYWVRQWCPRLLRLVTCGRVWLVPGLHQQDWTLLRRHGARGTTEVQKSFSHFLQVRLGDLIWTQNGSDWPQMGKIRDFFRSDFSTFCRCAKMYWNLIWKSHEFFPFGANLTHFGFKSGHPVLVSPRTGIMGIYITSLL